MTRVLVAAVLTSLTIHAASGAAALATATATSKARGVPRPSAPPSRFGWVDVRDFGARGDYDAATDSGTDDTAAIQAAIDSGRPVHFSPGVYLVTRPLVLPVMPSSVRLFGENSMYEGSGRRGTVHVHSKARSLFVPSIPSTRESASAVSVRVSGLSFQASSALKGEGVVFDSVALAASDIHDNIFYGFKNVISGLLKNVSRFHGNTVVACTGPALARSSVLDPAIAASVDSEVTDNYFNGDPSRSDVTLLDLRAASSFLVANNYFDFAFRGLYTGGGNGLVTIRDNTFDILFNGITIAYGAKELSISGNRFLRIRKDSVSYFKRPSEEMATGRWTCILVERFAKDIAVAGNTIRDSDTFLALPFDRYKNIKEWGNVGSTGFSGPVVDMSHRSVDPTFPGDGTGFDFESMRMQALDELPDPVHGSYEGHVFWFGNTLLVNRGGYFLDAMGGSTLGRRDLIPNGGSLLTWASGTSCGASGRALVCAGAPSRPVHVAFDTPLAAGTYVVFLHVTRYKGGGVTPVLSMADGATRRPNGPSQKAHANGASYFQFDASAPVLALDLYLENFSGSVDGFFLVKI